MPHSFDVWTESPAGVEQIHAAFAREDYWQARIAGDANTTLDSLVVDPDGTVEVRCTQHAGRQLLPDLFAKVVPRDLKLVHSETWRAEPDGQVRGQISILVSGGLGSTCAENLLTPTDTGSRMRSEVRVEVKIPLLGGRLEKSLAGSTAERIPEIVRFTTEWIAEKA